MHPPTLMVGNEPEFADVCANESDRMILRNIVYTIWAMNKSSNESSSSCYVVGFSVVLVHTHTHVTE